MKFDIVTIFPNLFSGFLTESLLARAQLRRPRGSESRPQASGKKPLLIINTHNLRKWTTDKHKTVDDRPYGGGAGMLLKIEPIFKAVSSIKPEKPSGVKPRGGHATFRGPRAFTGYKVLRGKNKKTRVILLSAKGKTFTQKDARRLAKYGQIILICGRYEGVDERVAKYIADEEISIGNYVLFGGEVAAMVMIEAVSRLIPGVVAKSESIKNESFSDKRAITKEYPQYTRPEVFKPKIQNSKFKIRNSSKAWRVPKVLLSGDHNKVNEWRRKHSSIASKK